ncbi:MAG: archaellin/type IV pilin N-terminal domain-containing protein [Thermoplasmata archaeon]
MKILYKKDKGVSPVIATILMVAITVVLASAVYLMVSGYIGGSPSKPVALGVSPSTNATATEFLITSGNISVTSGSPLIITITPTSGAPVSATLTSVATPSSQPTGYTVHVYSVTGNQYLAAGDTISISTSSNAPLPPGTTVTFTYNGNVIYKYTA